MAIQTRALLYGTYRAGQLEMSYLTHAVEVDAGRDVRVLCGRASLASLADRFATDIDAVPTCTRCAHLRRKLT